MHQISSALNKTHDFNHTPGQQNTNLRNRYKECKDDADIKRNIISVHITSFFYQLRSPISSPDSQRSIDKTLTVIETRELIR